MKLYNLDNSPFSARVRMQIRHKQLAIEMCAPPHPTRTPEFAQFFPLGKVPALEIDKGCLIGESTAIMNYLEDAFDETPMVPKDALAKAQNEMLIRYVDNHLALPLGPLFQEYFAAMQTQTTPQPSTERLLGLQGELQKAERLLNELPNFRDRDLQTGDLCLASNLYYVAEIADFFGEPTIFDGLSKLNEWQEWVADYPAVSQSVAEIETAHQTLMKSFGVVK